MQLEPGFGRKRRLHLCSVLVHFYLSVVPTRIGGSGLTKNPRLAGNRGFQKIFYGSEWSPHVANGPDAVLPAGHLSADLRDAQLDAQRGFHFELRTVNNIVARLSKRFPARLAVGVWGRGKRDARGLRDRDNREISDLSGTDKALLLGGIRAEPHKSLWRELRVLIFKRDRRTDQKAPGDGELLVV